MGGWAVEGGGGICSGGTPAQTPLGNPLERCLEETLTIYYNLLVDRQRSLHDTFNFGVCPVCTSCGSVSVCMCVCLFVCECLLWGG